MKTLDAFDSLKYSCEEQVRSFTNFIKINKNVKKKLYERKLSDVFKQIFPIKVLSNGIIRKINYISYKIIFPEHDFRYCIQNAMTYKANIKVKFQFTIGKFVFYKNLFLFSLPLITDDGFFIINGLKRVMLVQCVRNFGVYFSNNTNKIATIYSNLGSKIVFLIVNDVIIIKIRNRFVINVISFMLSLRFFKNANEALLCFFKKKNIIQYNKKIKNFIISSDYFVFIFDKNKIITIENLTDLNNLKNIDFVYVADKNQYLIFNTFLNMKYFTYEDSVKSLASMLIFSDAFLNVKKSENIIKDVFFNKLKYNLDFFGRSFMNFILKNKVSLKQIFLVKNDFISIIKYILDIVNGKKKIVNNDGFKNKVFRKIGDLLYFKLLRIFINSYQNIKDSLFLMRLSINENNDLVYKKTDRRKNNDVFVTLNKTSCSELVNYILNFKFFTNSVLTFFKRNELCQLLDDTNELSVLSHMTRQTFTGESGLKRQFAPFKVRDLKFDGYNKVCPVQTPENNKIGLNFALTLFSKIDCYGLLSSPYYQIVNGIVMKNKIIYLNVFEEINQFLGNFNIKLNLKNQIIDKKVLCKFNDSFLYIDSKKVNFIEATSLQSISLSAACVPFFGHSDGNRILLSTNQQRQVVPVIGREIPIVKTGLEQLIPKIFKKVLYSSVDGVVEKVDSKTIIIKRNNGNIHIISLYSYTKNNKFTLSLLTPNVVVGQKVKINDVLADDLSTKNGILSLGINLNVAIMPFYGLNYEDSIVVNEKIKNSGIFSSFHIREIPIDVFLTKYGPEILSNNIYNISENRQQNMGENGIIKIGTYIKKNDLLISKLRPKKKTRLKGIDNFVKSLTKNDLVENFKEILTFERKGITGYVTEIKRIKNTGQFNYDIIERIIIVVTEKQNLSIGDKVCGRYGNKAIISSFIPEEDMPYTKDGKIVDVILSPLSIISRMNISQIQEMHFNNLIIEKKLKNQDVVAFNHNKLSNDILKYLENDINKGKTELYNGYNGKKFVNKVMVGKMYIMKLEHIAKIKKHARSVGNYNKITEQPTQGKINNGGQRLSSLFMNTLIGYGANNIIREFFNEKSDDIFGRCDLYKRIVRNQSLIKRYRGSEIIKMIQNYFNSMGLKLRVFDEKSTKPKVLSNNQDDLKKNI